MAIQGFSKGEAFTLVHSADLHLGSGMAVARRLGREDDLKSATYEALENICSVVEQHDARVLTLAGDLFDEADLFNPVPRLKLRKAVARMPGTAVAVVRGNHDHHHPRAPPLALGSNAFEFKGNAKTWDLGWVRVHGVSYSNPKEEQSLVPRYPAASEEKMDIGLLHANVGNNADHARYAPCDVDELVNHGYDMWLLGHIHKRDVLSEDPLILYPGNIQGRSVRETGSRSVEVVHVDDAVHHEPVPVHSVLWNEIGVDVTSCESDDEVIDVAASAVEAQKQGLGRGRGAVLRINLSGRTRLHETINRTPKKGQSGFAQIVQEHLNDAYADQDPFILVDRVRARTESTFDLEELVGKDNVMGVLVDLSRDAGTRHDALQVLRAGPVTGEEAEALISSLWDEAVQGCLGRIRGRQGP